MYERLNLHADIMHSGDEITVWPAEILKMLGENTLTIITTQRRLVGRKLIFTVLYGTPLLPLLLLTSKIKPPVS